MAQPTGRPRFSPSPCDTDSDYSGNITPLKSTSANNNTWSPIVSCPADFPLDLFESALEQLIHHPEYNSTLILRSETLSDSPRADVDGGILEGFRPVHNIHRRLLPRRPGRDADLEQNCTLYALISGEYKGMPSTLVLTPLVPTGGSLPYYHPTVKHLAFRYIPSTTHSILRIEAVLLPDTPTDLNSRLYRTCLALLETLHRYGWGALTNYQKRVKHDRIIPREEYQDLYLIMRERYKHLIGEWKEVTDPLKHVFEDIGIATFLILLWKRTFDGSESDTSPDNSHHSCSEPDPCICWPRPPGGFLDLGCGNGLLTHILVSEGYEGHGIDLRARTSWESYPERTRAALHVHALDPTSYSDFQRCSQVPYIKPGLFLIGNHADELTPWLPILATLEHASGYLSIPCCSWSFDERFSRSTTTTKFSVAHLGSVVDAGFVEGLNLGGEGSHQSQYSMYRIWLAGLSQWLGWKVECDTLRIPSTRNWAIIGRERLNEDETIYSDRALKIIQEVIQRGVFKTRKPEGKAGDH